MMKTSLSTNIDGYPLRLILLPEYNLVPRAARTSPSKDSTARSYSRCYLEYGFDWSKDIQIRTDLNV